MYSHHHPAAEVSSRSGPRLTDAPAAPALPDARAARTPAGTAEQLRTTQPVLRRVDECSPTAPLVLRAALPDDRHALARMLSELSPRSSFERFFTGGVRVSDR